jgi:MFS family permease
LTTTPSLTPQAEKVNFRNYVIEVAWFGIGLAATSRFLSVYAIRVGATALELGWMTSLPFMFLLLSTTISTWWRNRFQDPMRSYFLPSVGFRLTFLLPALTPLFPLRFQPLWLIFSVVLPAIPQGLSSTIFVSMMRDAIPHERQTPLASKRMLWMNVTTGVGALAFGFWLEQAPFPLNYQVMFLLAFVMALVSHCCVMNVKLPKTTATIQTTVVKSNAAPLRSPVFLSAVLVVVIAHIGFLALASVIPLHLVKNMGADEGFMAIYGIAEIVASASICLFTDRIIRKFGSRKVIAIAVFWTGVAAMTMALTHNLTIVLIAGAVSGAAWIAGAVAMYGLFIDATKDVASQDMTRYTTVYNQLVWIAAFIGPMVGSNLANVGVNLMLVMVIGAAMRLIAGLMIYNMDGLLYVPARRILNVFPHLRQINSKTTEAQRQRNI